MHRIIFVSLSIILKGPSEVGGGPESPVLRESPADSLGKKHHIAPSGGPLSSITTTGPTYGGVTSQKGHDGLEVVTFGGGQDRKVSRVQKGKH